MQMNHTQEANFKYKKILMIFQDVVRTVVNTVFQIERIIVILLQKEKQAFIKRRDTEPRKNY